MGAVGTMKPETQAAKDLERFATPLTMQSLGDMSYAGVGRQLGAGRRLRRQAVLASWC